MIATKTIKPDRAPESLPMDFVPASAPPALPPMERRVRLDDIVAAACRVLFVSRETLFSQLRPHRAIMARAVVTLVAKELGPWSYPDISEAMGKGRTAHSSFLTGKQRLESLMKHHHIGHASRMVTMPHNEPPVDIEVVIARVRNAAKASVKPSANGESA